MHHAPMGISRVDRRDRFNFVVEKWWDGKPFEIVAGAQSMSAARAAFDVLVEQEPNRQFILSKGALVLKKYPKDLELR